MSSHRAYQLYACQKSAVRVLRSAVLADHVHLIVSFRPDSRLSDFVRVAKSVAALRANRRVPGAVRWARGFYAATLHKQDLSRVMHYVAHQFDRHPDKREVLLAINARATAAMDKLGMAIGKREQEMDEMRAAAIRAEFPPLHDFYDLRQQAGPEDRALPGVPVEPAA